MIGSKNKNRVVLPSRPEPPSMDQILEDIHKAAPDDPVFSILDQEGHEPVPDSEVELRFQQCRRFLDLNERLEEAQTGLLLQREGLQAAGEELQKEVTQ
ncbi:unnamed protein product, partial [Tetraodon nigroviridis]